MEVSDRISAICQETWDRFTQAVLRNEEPRLAEWPKAKPSVEELVEVVADGAIFDGLARCIDKEMAIQTQMVAVGAIQDFHFRLVGLVRDWAKSQKWNDGGEPTDALRKAVRAIVSLISHGGEIRGPYHGHAVVTLGGLFWEAKQRNCSDVLLRAVCDELVHRSSKGLISRFDVASIVEEIENHRLSPYEVFSASASSTVNLDTDEEELSLRV